MLNQWKRNTYENHGLSQHSYSVLLLFGKVTVTPVDMVPIGGESWSPCKSATSLKTSEATVWSTCQKGNHGNLRKEDVNM